MAPQPRRGRELHAVGLLVQADPQTEVAGIDVEFALGVDDVGRHQGQSPGRRVAVGVRWQEQLVLAEDLSGQVGQDRAELHPGDPGTDRAGQVPGRTAVQPVGAHLLEYGFEYHSEPVDVGSNPSGAVHDDRGARGFEGVHSGEVAHVPGRHAGELAQLRHGLPRVGQVHLRPRAHEADTGIDGYVPVDHSHTVSLPTENAGARGSGLYFRADPGFSPSRPENPSGPVPLARAPVTNSRSGSARRRACRVEGRSPLRCWP